MGGGEGWNDLGVVVKIGGGEEIRVGVIYFEIPIIIPYSTNHFPIPPPWQLSLRAYLPSPLRALGDCQRGF